VTVQANAGLRLLAFAGLLLSLTLTLVVAPVVEPAVDRLPAALCTWLIGVPMILWGTTTVRLRGDRLDVVNPVLVSAVRLADVACLDHRRGLEVVLTSGQRVQFAGSAPSLIGMTTRYWSARRAIDRIETAVGRPLTTPLVWQPGDHRVTYRPRTQALSWCAAYVVIDTTTALWLGAALE